MLIDLKKAVRKYSMQIRGCVHVGGHFGQEYMTYKVLGIRNIVFIEPCANAFNALVASFEECEDVKLFNCACGAEEGTATMYTETANTGMSNSLLKPVKHLDQYPSIQFTGREDVEVKTLDSLDFDKHKYNMLCMDVQGYEAEVLKGATETLQHIDYVYCEVNRDEIYEGCAKVWDLDVMLKDFTRVETSWAGGQWGDAIYIKNKL
jgi:FkbM family methyltransferase